MHLTRPVWTLRASIKWLLERAIMSQLYPAQNSIWKSLSHYFNAQFLEEEKQNFISHFQEEGYLVESVLLEKNNLRSSGLFIAHPDQLNNGKWVLQATGNSEPVEWAAKHYAKHYLDIGYNLLMINNPGVGKSDGVATPKTMAETQELAIQYLEQKHNATKLVLAGFSLGGAAIGQAILHHSFDPKRHYLVIRQMTFDRVSSIFEEYAESTFPHLKPLIKPIIQWAECEMDSIAVSERLQTLQIPEVIIQAGTDGEFQSDGTIPAKASLAYHLHKLGITDPSKTFHTIPNARHRLPATQTITAILQWEN
jgi:pimeloyl-ACP methyl ester carboxylesterase